MTFASSAILIQDSFTTEISLYFWFESTQFHSAKVIPYIKVPYSLPLLLSSQYIEFERDYSAGIFLRFSRFKPYTLPSYKFWIARKERFTFWGHDFSFEAYNFIWQITDFLTAFRTYKNFWICQKISFYQLTHSLRQYLLELQCQIGSDSWIVSPG